ncbi:PLC-like phosphodiesterase, partial [Podospora conica]
KILCIALANPELTAFTDITCLKHVTEHNHLAAAQWNGALHVVVVTRYHYLEHFVFESVGLSSRGLRMVRQGSPCLSARPVSRPSLVVFRNMLFLAWVGFGKVWYSTLSAESDPRPSRPWYWSRPIRVTAGVHRTVCFEEGPALIVWHNRLFLHCESEKGVLLCCEYSYSTATWLPCERHPTLGSTIEALRGISGGSATNYGDTSFLASFETVEEAGKKTTRDEEVAIVKRAGGQAPQLAIFNGRLHCIFIKIYHAKHLSKSKVPRTITELMWFSRRLLSFNLSSWMAHCPDNTPLSRLTIPGTHEYNTAQPLTLWQQLDLGIRFFDLRIQLETGGLFCRLGSSTDGLRLYSFSDMMRHVFTFLMVEPSETVLIHLNADAHSYSLDPSRLESAVRTEINTMATDSGGRFRWYTLSDTPDLGSVRSQAVLLRRFPLQSFFSPPLGIELRHEPDKVFVLDKFFVSEDMSLATLVKTHSVKVVDHMFRHSKRETGTWSVAFCSAAGTRRNEPLDNLHVAVGAHSILSNRWVDGMNVTLAEFLRNMSPSGWNGGLGAITGFGIVHVDFPDESGSGDVVSVLIEMNLPPELRRSLGGPRGTGGFGLFATPQRRVPVAIKAEGDSGAEENTVTAPENITSAAEEGSLPAPPRGTSTTPLVTTETLSQAEQVPKMTAGKLVLYDEEESDEESPSIEPGLGEMTETPPWELAFEPEGESEGEGENEGETPFFIRTWTDEVAEMLPAMLAEAEGWSVPAPTSTQQGGHDDTSQTTVREPVLLGAEGEGIASLAGTKRGADEISKTPPVEESGPAPASRPEQGDDDNTKTPVGQPVLDADREGIASLAGTKRGADEISKTPPVEESGSAPASRPEQGDDDTAKTLVGGQEGEGIASLAGTKRGADEISKTPPVEESSPASTSTKQGSDDDAKTLVGEPEGEGIASLAGTKRGADEISKTPPVEHVATLEGR